MSHGSAAQQPHDLRPAAQVDAPGGAEASLHRTFEEIFRSNQPARDKFLARLFGLFNEEVVRYWCRLTDSPYEDLGRPTLWTGGRRYTLDFTLRQRDTGQIFVAEMKCELEFEKYRYLRLTDAWQIEHHRQLAFQSFLTLAKAPDALPVTVGGKPCRVDGALLVWGAITGAGRRAAMQHFGFSEVLSVEAMLQDLAQHSDHAWRARILEMQGWSWDLFGYLASPQREQR